MGFHSEKDPELNFHRNYTLTCIVSFVSALNFKTS